MPSVLLRGRASTESANAFSAQLASIPRQDEPAAGAPDTVRVQLRIEGMRVVRRFLKFEPASSLFGFAADYLQQQGMPVPRVGFTLVGALPGEVLKLDELLPAPSKTFETAKLGGASFFLRAL